MKALTAAAVVTATVASNVSYAQPTALTEVPAPLTSSLRYAQPEDTPQLHPALASKLDYAQSSPPSVRPISPEAGEEANEIVSRPKTPVEFARNLQVIFDHDLLLQDDFYTEASLKNVFNLAEVRISGGDDGAHRQVSIASSHFVSIFPWTAIPGRSDFTPSAQLVGARTIHESGLITAGINFGMDEGGPDFVLTWRIFGEKFSRLRLEPTPHGSPPPATAPHGNEKWRYQQVDGQTEKMITLGFNPAGQLDRVVIEINKNQEQER
jgi:hypothetical protein